MKYGEILHSLAAVGRCVLCGGLHNNPVAALSGYSGLL